MAQEEKGLTKWHWFIIFTIALIITFVFIFFLLKMVNIDPFEALKKRAENVPVLSNLIEENRDELTDQEILTQRLEDEKKQLKKELQKQQEIIRALEMDLSIKEKEVQDLKQEIRSLNTIVEDDKNEPSVDVAGLYSKMSASKAAEAIALLDEEEAFQILTSIKQDQLARILEKLEPEDRAKYTKLLSNQTSQ